MEVRIHALVKKMQHHPKSIRFSELQKVCEYYFGAPRKSGGSHCVYKMPWAGNPRVNIQNSQGNAKVYQVKQVLQALERLKEVSDA